MSIYGICKKKTLMLGEKIICIGITGAGFYEMW